MAEINLKHVNRKWKRQREYNREVPHPRDPSAVLSQEARESVLSSQTMQSVSSQKERGEKRPHPFLVCQQTLHSMLLGLLGLHDIEDTLCACDRRRSCRKDPMPESMLAVDFRIPVPSSVSGIDAAFVTRRCTLMGRVGLEWVVELATEFKWRFKSGFKSPFDFTFVSEFVFVF